MKPISHYVKKLRDRCIEKFGSSYVAENEELIECAARNKRLLDRFDAEIDESDLISISTGSQGQQKEDINPLVKHRNDVAKLYADNLEALQLTPRSRYKKTDGKVNEEDDKLADLSQQLASIKQ